MTLPVTTREYVLDSPRSFSCVGRMLPELPDGWVRIRFHYCGICGSDLSKFEGRREIDYPASLGHEFVAEVVSVGREVTTFRPGNFVTSDLNYRCEACDQCGANRSHLCRRGQEGLFTNRAFAELADIHASYLTQLPSRDKRFVLSEPLSCVLHALQWGRPEETDRILVLGAGGLGSCMAFALTQKGSGSFVLTDSSAERLSLLEPLISPCGQAVAAPSGEYDLVFDLTGSESGLRFACDHVKPGGRLCSMSHLDGYASCHFLLPSLTRKDVSFIVSYLNGARRSLSTAVDLLDKAWSPAWDRTLEVVDLQDLQKAFECRRSAPSAKIVVAIGELHR